MSKPNKLPLARRSANESALKQTSAKKISEQIVLASLEKKASPWFAKLEKAGEIKTAEDFLLKGEQIKTLKLIAKEAEVQLATVTNPQDTIIKAAKQTKKAAELIFEPFFTKIATLETAVKNEMLAFNQKQQEKQIKLDNKFSEGKGSIATYVNKSTQLVAHKAGPAKTRLIKKLRIVDKTKIPLEYMEPMEATIKSLLMAGVAVPGAELYEEENIAI